jgi:DNA modification methylase
MILKSRIKKLDQVNWSKMKFIQDDTFKISSDEEYEKVARSILNNDWVAPFYVWEDEDGTVWCLDGKRRETVLSKIKEEGGVKVDGEFKSFEVPDELPALYIDAPDKKSASKLVLQYSSQFGTITREGLFNFLQAYDLDFNDIRLEISLPEFSMPRFEQQFDLYGLGNDGDDNTYVDDAVLLDDDIAPIVKLGDFFQLGEHRILCGSCLEDEVIATLMQGEKARILCTDPPYNIPYKSYGGKGKTQHTDFKMATGEMSDEDFVAFIAHVMRMACENSVDGAIHGLFMDFRHSWHMGEAARQVYGSPEPKQICVWAKKTFANGAFYRSQHEFCYFYKHGKAKHLSHLELVDRIRTNVWSYDGINSFNSPDRELSGIGALSDHPTPKNSEMVADWILDLTNQGDIVLEPFSGSGTTLIAGERTKRKVYATELEPRYVQSTIIRYINHCNKVGQLPQINHLNGELTLADFQQLIN